MGLDAYMHFRAVGDVDDLYLTWPMGYGRIVESTPDKFELQDYGANYTHSINTGSRYYGPGGGSGPGNIVVACLMALLRHPNVEKVWYGFDQNKWMLVTLDDVVAIAKQWVGESAAPMAESKTDGPR